MGEIQDMKKKMMICSALGVLFLFTFSCRSKTATSTAAAGAWEGCVIGFYPENGNEMLPGGDQKEIDDFEKIIRREVGSVVWFPTWDDEFPLEACQGLHARGIIPHLTWELFWPWV